MRTVRRLTVCVLLAAAALAQPATALAQEMLAPPAPPGDEERAVYQGVVPAVRDEPAMPIPRTAPPTRLTFPGFQLREGRAARVFAQFTAPPAYETREEGGRFVVEFHNATAWRRNNLRRMDTRHFGTAVRAFQVRAGGKGTLRLEIDAKTTQPPAVHVEQSGAWHYLYVDFAPPPVDTTPAPSQAEDRERPR